MKNPQGIPLGLDPEAKSASKNLPAFLTPPKGSKAYHGFPLVKDISEDGFTYGMITQFESNTKEGYDSGDAYVEAPDGSRAGIVWGRETAFSHNIITKIEKNRWGVYYFAIPFKIKTKDDMRKAFDLMLPYLKEYYRISKAHITWKDNFRRLNKELHSMQRGPVPDNEIEKDIYIELDQITSYLYSRLGLKARWIGLIRYLPSLNVTLLKRDLLNVNQLIEQRGWSHFRKNRLLLKEYLLVTEIVEVVKTVKGKGVFESQGIKSRSQLGLEEEEIYSNHIMGLVKVATERKMPIEKFTLDKELTHHLFELSKAECRKDTKTTKILLKKVQDRIKVLCKK